MITWIYINSDIIKRACGIIIDKKYSVDYYYLISLKTFQIMNKFYYEGTEYPSDMNYKYINNNISNYWIYYIEDLELNGFSSIIIENSLVYELIMSHLDKIGELNESLIFFN